MRDLKVNQDIKVLAITWHQIDNWYGKNYRVILIKDNETGFDTLKETKLYRSLLINYINHEWKRYLTSLDKCKVTKDFSAYNILSSFETYRYCRSGPSYACSNTFITVAELLEWKEKYERSSEFVEKKQAAEWRQKRKLFTSNKKRKHVAI